MAHHHAAELGRSVFYFVVIAGFVTLPVVCTAPCVCVWLFVCACHQIAATTPNRRANCATGKAEGRFNAQYIVATNDKPRRAAITFANR